MSPCHIMLSQISTGDKDSSVKKLMKKLLLRKVSLQVSFDSGEEKLGQCHSEQRIKINGLQEVNSD